MTHLRSDVVGSATPALRLPFGLTVATVCCLALPAPAAHGGPLADPTRPPAALLAPGGMAAAALPHKANLDTARAIAAAARAAEAAAPPPAPALVQGVQLPANGPASALVDGKPVKVGDQLDGRTVLAIDAQGLLVKGPRGPERLWLLAGASKQQAGSITASQWTRYHAAPPAGVDGAANAAAGADMPATAAQPTATQPSGLPTAPLGAPGSQAANSTAPKPVSLAGRTAP